MCAPMLSNAADDKVDDGLWQVHLSVLVDSVAVRPKPDEFIHAKEDTNDVTSDLNTVLSLNEAQKFQSIKGEGLEEASPDPANCIAINGVGDTVIVPAADIAVRILPESVFGVPSVKTRPEQTYEDTGGDKGSDGSEVPNPSFASELVFNPPAALVALEMS